MSSSGGEAVELARAAGLALDPWQEFIVDSALGERADGKWSAFEVGVEVSRQNGKGSILEARELAGLFLLGERLLIHSAHQFDTSLEAFRRLLALIEEADFQREIKRVSRSHGEEGIELKSGQRIRFRTRTKGGGRGFTADWLGLDEAMVLPESMLGALLPTMSARPNPQVWYAGSAVDQVVHEHGVVFARVRERGRRGGDPSLAWFEFTAGDSLEEAIQPEFAADPVNWARANPGLGIRISLEHVAREQRSMDARTFAVERLGVGDWPATDAAGGNVISAEDWLALRDAESSIHGDVVFAFDVTPDRSRSSICAAGAREDGVSHVEVIEHRAGTNWIGARLAELVQRHGASAVVCDAAGPAGSLLGELETLGVEVVTVTAREYAQACGVLFDAVADDTVRHLGTNELSAAVRGAAKRQLGEAWAWSRKSSAVDISPLVAATLALWRSRSDAASVYEDRGVLAITFD